MPEKQKQAYARVLLHSFIKDWSYRAALEGEEIFAHHCLNSFFRVEDGDIPLDEYLNAIANAWRYIYNRPERADQLDTLRRGEMAFAPAGGS